MQLSDTVCAWDERGTGFQLQLQNTFMYVYVYFNVTHFINTITMSTSNKYE